nr:unnamed protein product [Spirometra erinaceieuropaei]
MVSFDVVSLFTSIPRALAVETLSDLLQQNYDEGDGFTVQDLIELMWHCLKTFSTYEEATYERIKGTQKGSPISGPIAEALLQKLEDCSRSTKQILGTPR